MYTHDRPPTYWHVHDGEANETIATYTTELSAYHRMHHERTHGHPHAFMHTGKVDL